MRIPVGVGRSLCVAALVLSSPAAAAEKKSVHRVAGVTALSFAGSEISNKQCVDPSVAAQPENLDRPICMTPPPAPAGNPNWFRYGSFVPLDGRVGYHMVSKLNFFDHDVPPECNHDPANSYMLAAAVEGSIPPGLKYDEHQAAFEGTPRQPGNWDLDVSLSHFRCRNSDLDFGDRRIHVHLYIAP